MTIVQIGRVSAAGLIALRVTELESDKRTLLEQNAALRREIVALKVELGRKKYRKANP